MKNNKYQITGIKGRLLHLGFVTCYLLIVLLYACEGGYQPSIKDDGKSILFAPEAIQEKKDTSLVISCVKPNSMSEDAISIKVTLNPEYINLPDIAIYDVLNINPESDFHESLVFGENNNVCEFTVKKMSSIALNLKASHLIKAGPEALTVTVEPGNVTTSIAVSTYIVTFYKNYGETETNPQKRGVVNSGETIDKMPTPPEPSDSTQIFDSWNTQADGKGTTFDRDTSVKKDIDVYAKWTPKPTTPPATP